MGTPETTPDTPVRLCANCRGGMQRHQDWCLECGTAAPGRLGGVRPGWRAVTTTLALTLVLVGGAGAASYAALSSDANREAIAAAPLDGTPVAQAPPAVPAPPAPVVPAPVAPVAPVPAPPAPAPPVAPPVSPVAPAGPKITAQVTPPKSPSPSPSQRAVPRSDVTAAGSRGKGTNAEGESSSPARKLEPIALGAGALSVYDPYKRAVSSGTPAKAHDGDAKTTFTLGAPDDGRELQVGLVVDLQTARQVRGVDLTTTTPGGRVEVYATDGSALPPDILDTRWDHPGSRSDVDGGTRGANKAGDGVERIVFPKGGDAYRYVTLWFTTPPEGTTRVGLAEVTVLG